MSVSATTASALPSTPLAGTNLLTVLSEAAANTAQLANTQEVAAVNTDIQKRLNAQIAILQAPPDPALTGALQSQITALQSQQTSITNLSPKYGGNANTLNALQTQLANLQTAAAAGNSQNFDTALAAANLDVQNLTVVNAPAPLQPDQVITLQGKGLGISNSATYDLSTAGGQAAAAAAVSSAQGFVQQVFQYTSSNQILATDLSNRLSTQINSLTAQQRQLEGTNQTQVQTEIANLTQQAQDQEHLIELALGNTQTIASALSAAENPPQPINSVFGALEQAVAATPSTYSSSQSSPAILSLLT